MKRLYIILSVVLLVGGSGITYYLKAAAGKVSLKYVTAAATKGTLVSTISGTGNVVVDQITKVNPALSGTVSNLSVKLGDQVKKGQPLFTIVNSQLDVTVSRSYAAYLQAKQTLASAQSNVITTQAASTNQTLDSGQAKAQTNLDQSNQALTTAQTQLTQDQVSQPVKVTSDQQSVTTAQDSLSAATIALQQSQNSASANAQAAHQQYEAAVSGVTIAQENVNSALTDYTNQKATAAQRSVTAPIDGTITTLSVSDGDQLGSSTSTSAVGSATTSSTPIVIADLSSLKISVQINEVDAPKVLPGKKASMSFDAIDSLVLTGKVEKIDTVGTVTSGVVSYAATITFDALDLRVKPGMSVSSIITTGIKQDVITVPNSSVKSATSGTYVQLLQNSLPVQQAVQVGIANDTDTEIVSGLNEGDLVITQTISSTAAKTAATSGSLNLLGGGGAGRTGSGRGGN